MGVVLHGVPNDVGHFVEPTVFQFPQRMEQPALHGFETVFQRGNCAFQDDVGGVIQEIILVHGAHPGRSVFERNQLRRLHLQLRTFVVVRGLRSGDLLSVRRLFQAVGSGIVRRKIVQIVRAHTAASSNSTRRFSMMNSWRSGVFLPM